VISAADAKPSTADGKDSKAEMESKSEGEEKDVKLSKASKEKLKSGKSGAAQLTTGKRLSVLSF